MREPGTGRPGPLARLLAVLIIIGLIGVSAPVLAVVFSWIFGLL